jgi:hypothetical protein
MIDTQALDVSRDLKEHTNLRRASAAVGVHNLKPSELNFAIEFGRMPFTFLLMTMDELQEWNRAKEDHMGTPAFELCNLEVREYPGRTSIEITFDCGSDCEGSASTLRSEIAGKRHKLANLLPYQIGMLDTEMEIHAHFSGLPGGTETVVVPVTHRGDVHDAAARGLSA